MSPFTLNELKSNSASYFEQLAAQKRLGHPRPRVCHHFFPLDDMAEDVYLPELPKWLKAISVGAAGVDVIGDPVGIEVWFFKEPEPGWIEPLIDAYHEAAIACSAVYGGWSYEPDRRDDPISTDMVH